MKACFNHSLKNGRLLRALSPKSVSARHVLQPRRPNHFNRFQGTVPSSPALSSSTPTSLAADDFLLSQAADDFLLSQALTKPHIKNLGQSDSGLLLNWSDGHQSVFHNSWLFRCCTCTSCKQPHSGQRLRRPDEIPPNPAVHHAFLDGGDLVLHWEGEHHESRFGASWLLENCERTPLARKGKPLTRDDAVPEVDFSEVMASESGVFRWLDLMAEHGLVLVTNGPTEEGTVRQLTERIAPVQRTIYGELFEVVATDRPINIAYSNVGLPMHMDLIYYESPPALQMLHCMRFDPSIEGGATTFMDYVAVLEELRAVHPDAFAVLSRVAATFQKVHYERERPVDLVYQRPHIWLNDAGDIIGGAWAPSFEGPPRLPARDAQAYYEAYHVLAGMLEDPDSKHLLSIRLKPGETAAFSNRRMVHGRSAFTQPPNTQRALQGCYVTAEDFSSRLQTLARAHAPQGWVAPRLMFGNHK
mmetsp:Transcript_17189/g.40457  ORF Transcript_17189/g.40457 Transcript_17189/m.40457 type:complete len:472 (-) Transcript_17189:44-1459(-)